MGESHHGREYIIGAIGAIAEYLALRYGMNWLAWLAMLLMWLAIVEYTRRWAKGKAWIYIGWGGLFIAMGLATWFVIKPRAVVATSATSALTQSTPTASPINQPNTPLVATEEAPKKRPDKSRSRPPSPSQDNSVHVENGSNINQQSVGDCSPNIVGGSNTINCTPPLPSVEFTQKPIPSGSSLQQIVPRTTWGAPSPEQSAYRAKYETKPGVVVTVTLDGPSQGAGFVATCDRPCATIDATVGSMCHAAWGRTQDGKAALIFDTPSQIFPSQPVTWEIRSEDDKAVIVKAVELVRP